MFKCEQTSERRREARLTAELDADRGVDSGQTDFIPQARKLNVRSEESKRLTQGIETRLVCRHVLMGQFRASPCGIIA
jgi:hypothetical protein